MRAKSKNIIILAILFLITNANAWKCCDPVFSSAGITPQSSKMFKQELENGINPINKLILQTIKEQEAINIMQTEKLKYAMNMLNQYNIIELSVKKQEMLEKQIRESQCISTEILINNINAKITMLEQKIMLLRSLNE